MEKNIKKSYKNDKFKISTPTRNQLPDGSYAVSDIQDYFEYIIKKHKTFTDDRPIKTYVNKIKTKSSLKLKQGIITNS